MMNKKKKRIIAILFAFIIIVTLIGGTLAYWRWNSDISSHTGVAFTVNKDFTCSADGGEDLTSENINLVPTADCTNSAEALQRTIKIMPNIKKNNLTINLDLWLTVDNIGEGLTNSKNFMYALTTNPYSCTENVVTQGNFQGLTANSKVNLISGQEYTGTNLEPDTYYLYIWLDAAEENPATAKQSFKLSLGGECTNTPKPELPLIPNEYQQVEYIESTGTQYIDTGYMVNKNTRVKFDFRTSDTIPTDSSGALFYTSGDGSVNSNYGFAIHSATVGGYYRGFYGTKTYTSSEFLEPKTDYIVDFNKERLYLNDTLIHDFGNVDFEVKYTLPLLAQYYKTKKAINLAKSGTRIYRVEIWDNDVIKRDLIPCYRKKDNVIGLYDIVNNKFYTNDGTGNFLKGKNTYNVGELLNYKIEGNSVQSEIPTPSAPVQIESVGDKTTNLLKYPYANNSKDVLGVKFTDNRNGSVTVEGTSTGWATFDLSRYEIKLESGKKYYLKADGTYTGVSLIFAYKDGEGTTKYNGAALEWQDEYSNPHIYLQVNPDTNASGTLYPYLIEETNKDVLYEPYGYKIPITVRGKKLNNNSTDVHGYYIDGSGNLVRHAPSSYSQLIPVKPNTAYTLSCDATAATYVQNKRLHAYDKDGNWIGEILHLNYPEEIGGYQELSGVTPSDCAYVRISHIGEQENFIQLEEGTVATSNEDYIEPVKANIYLDEPLRKIGEYADYIDFKKKQVVRRVNQINLKDYTWSEETGNYNFYYIRNVLSTPIKSSATYTMSNILPGKDIGLTTNNIGIHAFVSGIVRARPDLTVYNTLAKWQEYINTHDAYLIYPIADEPTTMQLPNIPKYKGTQILEVNTEIEPSKSEIIK